MYGSYCSSLGWSGYGAIRSVDGINSRPDTVTDQPAVCRGSDRVSSTPSGFSTLASIGHNCRVTDSGGFRPFSTPENCSWRYSGHLNVVSNVDTGENEPRRAHRHHTAYKRRCFVWRNGESSCLTDSTRNSRSFGCCRICSDQLHDCSTCHLLNLQCG